MPNKPVPMPRQSPWGKVRWQAFGSHRWFCWSPAAAFCTWPCLGASWRSDLLSFPTQSLGLLHHFLSNRKRCVSHTRDPADFLWCIQPHPDAGCQLVGVAEEPRFVVIGGACFAIGWRVAPRLAFFLCLRPSLCPRHQRSPMRPILGKEGGFVVGFCKEERHAVDDLR